MEAVKEHIEQQLRSRHLRLDGVPDTHDDDDIYTTSPQILNVDQRRYRRVDAVVDMKWQPQNE